MKTIYSFVVILLHIISSVDLASNRRGVSVPNFSIRPPMLDRGRIHYKTTYACEGNPLHLTCEEGSSIHLVRANYGRFSISICNDGGRLDLNVICMSYRSFLIMSDRCSQKSNCSVVVSSKMFGDPCPGTMKYLEVQYHCVHGGASAATTTRRPPVQLSLPAMPSSSNTSLVLPPVPTTISPDDDVIPIISTESESLAKPESSISSSTQLTQSPLTSSTVESRFHHIEIIDSGEPVVPQISFNLPDIKDVSPTFPPNTRLNTPIKSEPSPSIPPPPPPPPVSIHKNHSIETMKKDYCPPIFVRSLFWNWTRKGEVADQKCPGGATGLVKWQCGYNQFLGSAEWMPEKPDFSQCRSLWLDNLEDRLNNDEPVIRIANELALMTLTKAMFCEDLQRIAFIVQKTLSHAITSMQNLQSFEVWHRHQVLKELLMFIVEAVSNLLDNAQDDAWLDLSVADRKRVASKLLTGLQLSALLLADNTNQDGSFAVAKPNVLVSVHVLDTRMPISLQFPTVEDTRGTNEWIRMEDSLFLPAQALLEYSKDGLAKVAFLAYQRIEDLLKPDLYSINERKESMSDTISMANKLQNITSGSLTINSRVIGASLTNGKSGDQQNIQLSHPITIVLRHIQEENISSPKCVYWNVERNDWLTDGCWMDSTNATHTICMCTHLTHFALLTDVRPIDLLEPQNNWLKLVVIIGCAIAMLSLVFITTIVYVVSAGNTEAVSIHRNLCVTLLIVEMTFLVGIYRTDIPILCGITAGSLHFFLLSSFLWTFLESFDLYLNLIDIYETVKSTKRLIWYYIIAYGGPALILLISLLIDPMSYGSQKHCWLRTDNYFFLSFVGPAVGIILGGLVFVLIACFILLNNSNPNTNIKCIEETKLELTRNGIKWVALLLFFQCLTWTLGLTHLNVQTSTAISMSFVVSNISLGLFVILFCVLNTDNIQHHRLIRGLPLMSFCFDDINCSNTKTNVTVSGSYPNRPVVTQVSATQVAGIVMHSSLQPQQSLAPPQAEQQFRPQPSNSQPENDSSTTRPDRPFISVQPTPREGTNVLSIYNSKREIINGSNGGTTGPILVNPINSVPTVNAAISDISAAALASHNLADYESKLQQIRQNSLSRQPKNRRKIRVHGSNHLDDNLRYGMNNIQTQMHTNLYNQYIEHIYESIDSDSMSSGAYDRRNRLTRRPTPIISQINDLYSGANITINPTSLVDDDWSQNSSSSYGPLYDDRPLLIESQSLNNSPNLNKPLISQELYPQNHRNSNLNIYDKNREELSSFRNNSRIRNNESNSQNVSPSSWNINPTTIGANSDLPDLVQDPIDASHNVTTVFVDGSKTSNKRLNFIKINETNNDNINNRSQIMSGQHFKPQTYC